MHKRICLILITMLFLLAASSCGEDNQTSESMPQIEIIILQTTPSLDHWLAEVAACAGEIPNFAIVTEIEPLEVLNLDQADLILRLGKRRENDPFVSVMGLEKTVILAGSEVPVDSLSQDSLLGIFTGELTNWNEVPEIKEMGVELNQPIQTLSYPEFHELRLLFQEANLKGDLIGSEPWIYATSEYLIDLLQSHPHALGYTLKSRLPQGVSTLNVSDLEEASVQHTVLAVTQTEPIGKLRQFLLCLQK